MTLLESTYRQLQSAGLVRCAEVFSNDFLGKNRNWYAYQTHTGRDFSADAAVQCLRNIRRYEQAQRLSQSQQIALKRAECRLLDYLKSEHCIAEVC